MRIISGKFKGRRIKYNNLQNVRPTTDRTKESLFNILNQYFIFEEISALDLFSGSGNISYELASRGVKKITSVEKNIKCVKFINNFSKMLDINLNVVNCSVSQFLNITKSKFNLIIADPPYTYSKEQIEALIDLIFGNSSSAFLEAPALNLPAINVGERQNGRVAPDNIINCNNYKEVL